MNQEETNIKARVRIFDIESDRPTMSIQEYIQLKHTMMPSNFKFEIGDIIETQDNGNYEVINIKISVLDEEISDHMIYGIETARRGTAFPYNFEVEVYLKKV